jgi:hypothetical protein
MRGVHSHAIEPCRDLGLGLVAAKLCGQGGADVLCQILGLGLRTRQAETEAKETVVMAFEQKAKGLPVSVCGR